jgi:hypothetical protein
LRHILEEQQWHHFRGAEVTIDGQVGGIEINKYQAGERVRLLPFPIFVPGWDQSEPSRESPQRRSRQTFDETLAATPRAVFVRDQEMDRRTKMIGNPGFARDLKELRADPVPGLNVTAHCLGRRHVDKGGVRVRAAQLSTGRIGIGWDMKACGKSGHSSAGPDRFDCGCVPLSKR